MTLEYYNKKFINKNKKDDNTQSIFKKRRIRISRINR
jgi:hypothetical protein